MSTFVSGYINDLSAVKDNIKLRVRVLRTWMQPVFSKPNISNMEIIVFDEQNTRMQGTVRQALVNGLKHQLEEGSAITLQRYSLGEIQPKYRIVKKPMRLSFLSNTIIEKCPDYTGSLYGFDFRPFTTITDLKTEEDGQFDVIGQVVACEELDNYDKNGRAGKKKPITLIDPEGNELNCTLWGSYAQQFCYFLNTCSDHGRILAVLQLAMMKIWDGKMCIQNGFNGTRLFLFNGKDKITTDGFEDVEAFRQSLVAGRGNETSDNTASDISTASRNSTKEDFVTKFPMRNIAELLDVEHGVPSIIVGTICAIQEEEGWWYLGCRTCRKKLVKTSEIVDLENETAPKASGKPNEWWCSKCKATVTTVKSQFRLQVRVRDETGTVSVALFNEEVQSMVDNMTAYQMVEKYGKSEGLFPKEILDIVDKKFVFKVSIDEYNLKKIMPVFNVMRMSNDPDIIESVCATATPVKPENEATSSKVLNITPLVTLTGRTSILTDYHKLLHTRNKESSLVLIFKPI